MREEKRKIRKGKLALVAAIIAVVLIIVIVLIIKGVNKKEQIGDSGKDLQDQVIVYDLPDVTYSDMQVKNIEMEYLVANNETMVSMTIDNTTQNAVSQETLTAYLIDSKGNTIGQTKTYIESLNPGQQYSISVVLKGDLTATTQIKLQK